jgi:tRNA dimethylallyltransferase
VEIISMDSRQVYRGLDVGTGKVGPRERRAVPHFGLDIRDPDQWYSAGAFSRDARRWIAEIRERGRVPLLVGGTGFFLRALTNPLFPEPAMDPARRAALRAFLSHVSEEALLRFVEVLDPARMDEAVAGGRHRAARTVEVALMTGRTLSWWHREGPPPEAPLEGVIVVLEMPRERLYDRINRRVGRMMEEGFPDEVRRLLEEGFGPRDPGMTGAGYREMVAYLQGRCSLPDAEDRIRRAHRRYARRQMTWNRHQLPKDAVFLDGARPEAELVEEVLRVWEGAHGGTEKRQEMNRRGSEDESMKGRRT